MRSMHRRRSTALAAFLGTASTLCSAAPAATAEPTVEVSGTVRTASGRPLAGAVVRVVDTPLSSETDPAGVFRLTVPAGELTLEAAHPAYTPVRRVLQLTAASRYQSFVLEPLHRLSDEVVVEAVRADALAPVSKKDLDSQDIAKLNFGQEMPVLLEHTPSVTQYSDTGSGSGYTYLYLRGIQQTRVNMTLDGVPLNDPEDSAVYFVDFGDFASSLSSVQVQRGVGTSTVGSAAYAGSINFASTDPSDRPELKATFGSGSFGGRRASVSAQSGRVGPGLALYGRASYQTTDGFREHSGVTQASGFFAASYQGQKSYLKVSGFVGHERTQLAFLAAPADVLATDLRANPLSLAERDRFEENLVQAQYTHALGSASTLTFQAFTVGAGGWYRLFANGPGSELQQYGLDWRFSGANASFRHARGSTSLTLGAHAYEDWSLHTRDQVGGGREYSNRGYKDEASAFAKLNQDLGRFHAYGDAQMRWARFRYDGSEPLGSVDWTFFNPRLGGRYELAAGLGLYGSVGRTTREPARSDMLAGEDNASLAYDLKAVKPESVTDYELGLEWRRPKVTLNADLYAMEFRHEIALTGELSEIGLPLRRNVDRSSRRGLELDLEWRPRGSLRISAMASLSRSRIASWTQAYDVYDTQGDLIGSVSRAYANVAPLLTPPASVKVGLDWPPTAWIGVGASGRWVSRTFLDNTDDTGFRTPAFFDLDATLRIALGRHSRGLRPTLRILATNLLNNRRSFASGYSYRFFTHDADGADSPGGTSYYYPLATRAVLVMLDLKI